MIPRVISDIADQISFVPRAIYFLTIIIVPRSDQGQAYKARESMVYSHGIYDEVYIYIIRLCNERVHDQLLRASEPLST